ncbi:hypothetical protein GCM10025777_08980 [Membranihabitans marinus]
MFLFMKLIFTFLLPGLLLLSAISCTKEEERKTFPLSAEIFHSVDGKQVAFTALTHSAVSWEWDFGDGSSSTEKNPVHVYSDGGYYLATLTAKDAGGNSVTKEVTLALELTPYAMLTGDYTAEGYQGKTWKLTANHSNSGDYFANADAGFSPVDGTPVPLPTGIFDLEFGMGAIYKDEFTFHFDGSYEHDVKEDNASFGGIVYQLLTNGGADIVNANGQDFGLCIAKYTPEANATFTFNPQEDYTVSSVYGPGGQLTYKDVSTLDFSGTEFIGFRDFERKVIVKQISNEKMQLAMFMAASPDYPSINTNAVLLSFEVVK